MIDQCRQILPLVQTVKVQKENHKEQPVQFKALLSSQESIKQTKAFVLITNHQIDQILLESQLRSSQVSI